MYLKVHGKNAKVAGYRIGGKTGTSEDGVNTNKYVTSFLGVAPIDDPQIVMLITLYNPTGERRPSRWSELLHQLEDRYLAKFYHI